MSFRILLLTAMAALGSGQIQFQTLNAATPRPDLARFNFAPVFQQPAFQQRVSFQPQVAFQQRVALPQAPVQRIPIVDQDGPAEYQFRYAVNDPITGDFKSQEESRLNDAVQGQYTLVQPDGLLRIVEYGANDATGFNAIVRYEPAGGRVAVAHPAVAKVVQ